MDMLMRLPRQKKKKKICYENAFSDSQSLFRHSIIELLSIVHNIKTPSKVKDNRSLLRERMLRELLIDNAAGGMFVHCFSIRLDD